MTASHLPETSGRAGAAPPAAPTGGRAEFGLGELVRGAVRRRAGLAWARLRHPRVRFGRRCDVRRGGQFLVARGASARFGDGCVLDRGLVVESRGRLEVGEGTVFGHHCTVASEERVTIGRRCLIAELVSVRDHDHAFGATDVAIIDQGRATAPVTIGDDVWIGGKATITRGVTIGDGAVVGAHAVVTSDLPAGSVAVGVPARVVRQRGPGGDPATGGPAGEPGPAAP